MGYCSLAVHTINRDILSPTKFCQQNGVVVYMLTVDFPGQANHRSYNILGSLTLLFLACSIQ